MPRVGDRIVALPWERVREKKKVWERERKEEKSEQERARTRAQERNASKYMGDQESEAERESAKD